MLLSTFLTLIKKNTNIMNPQNTFYTIKHFLHGVQFISTIISTIYSKMKNNQTVCNIYIYILISIIQTVSQPHVNKPCFGFLHLCLLFKPRRRRTFKGTESTSVVQIWEGHRLHVQRLVFPVYMAE